jgi:hypothetical protein
VSQRKLGILGLLRTIQVNKQHVNSMGNEIRLVRIALARVTSITPFVSYSKKPRCLFPITKLVPCCVFPAERE